MSRLLLMTGVLALSLAMAAGTEYHVSPTGNDDAIGSETAPWQTIQAAVDRLQPDDTLWVGEGNYPETVVIRVSGAADRPITLRAREGERVTLDPGSFTVTDQSHLVIAGFRVLNTRGNRPAIEVKGEGEFVEIRGNEVTGLVSNGAAAIRIGGRMHDFVIAENHVHHNNTGSQEAIRVHERTHGFQVIANEVNDNTNIGIDIVGWAQFGKPRDGLVRGNFAHNNSLAPGWGSGIYLDGSEDIIVEYNISTGHEFGYQIAVEPSDDTCSGNILRYNIAFENKEYGLGIGGYTGGEVFDCEVYHNVFVNNKREIGFSKNAGRDNRVVNNILYNPTGQSINYLGQPRNTVIDYNCYFVRYGDTPGEHSVVGDPGFANLPTFDFRLRDNSPCLGVGMAIFPKDETRSPDLGIFRVLGEEEASSFPWWGRIPINAN